MSKDRIERALEDDYLSRDPSPSKRAAYTRRTMEKARRWAERYGFFGLVLSRRHTNRIQRDTI
jgi:hypothetical protein